MKVPPLLIQRMLRWATPESLKQYGILDVEQYCDTMAQAQLQSFRSVHVAACPPLSYDDQMIHAAALQLDVPHVDDDNGQP